MNPENKQDATGLVKKLKGREVAVIGAREGGRVEPLSCLEPQFHKMREVTEVHGGAVFTPF